LTPRRASHVVDAYQQLLTFFQDPRSRPTPEHARDAGLRGRIRDVLRPFDPPRLLGIKDMDSLSEEAAPNRLAKLAVALSFGVSPAAVEKRLAAVRAQSVPRR